MRQAACFPSQVACADAQSDANSELETRMDAGGGATAVRRTNREQRGFGAGKWSIPGRWHVTPFTTPATCQNKGQLQRWPLSFRILIAVDNTNYTSPSFRYPPGAQEVPARRAGRYRAHPPVRGENRGIRGGLLWRAALATGGREQTLVPTGLSSECGSHGAHGVHGGNSLISDFLSGLSVLRAKQRRPWLNIQGR